MSQTQRAPEPIVLMDRDLIDWTDVSNFKLDPQKIKTDRKGLPVPFFTVIDLSKFFFAMSVDGVRWRIRERFFVGGGDPVCPHGVRNVPTGRMGARGEIKQDVWWFDDDGKCTKCGAIDYGTPQRKGELTGNQRNQTRVYSLADVERMVYAAVQNNVFDMTTGLTILKLVKFNAVLYGYLGPE